MTVTHPRLGWRSAPGDAEETRDVRSTCVAYIDAIASGDADALRRLRAPDAVTDFVHGDAFGSGLLGVEPADRVWRDWFHAFPEQRLDVTRTLLGAGVASLEWVATVRHLGELRPPIVSRTAPPSGREATFRGVTVLEVTGGLIRRETVYLDHVTLLVALGVEP